MAISIDNIVDVTVELSSLNSIESNFNLGMIMGNATAVAAKEPRVYLYTADNYKEQMVTDGYNATDAEYKAATAYFSQNPAPSNLVVGVIKASEKVADAFEAIRAANAEFYGCTVVGVTPEDTDVLALAAAVESSAQPTYYFHVTSDETCLNASTDNIMSKLMQANYRRTCATYSTNANTGAAILGVFSGLNTMQANSAYTMAFKSLVGIHAEDINNTQFANLKSYNGNAYVKAGRTYQFYLQGTSADGTHIDEVFFLDAAKFLIQENTLAGLVSQRKVPQTEDGMALIISYITQGCEALASIGVIGTGIWNGQTVKDLNTGDAVPGGYVVMADSLAEQPQADRERRVTPPIYVCLKGSGAIESVVIRVFVNR